jgi:hypothetical protein
MCRARAKQFGRRDESASGFPCDHFIIKAIDVRRDVFEVFYREVSGLKAMHFLRLEDGEGSHSASRVKNMSSDCDPGED